MNTHHKHHIHLLIVTYVLLAVASPLVWGGARADAMVCPTGYTCTPVQPVSNCPTGFVCTPTSAFGGGGGFSNTNTTTSLPPSATQSTACYSFASDLTVGNNGDTVRALQAFLVSRGYRTLPTGYFGSLTAAALAQYQAAHGISEDGYFGPATRAQVNTDCPSNSTTNTATNTSYYSRLSVSAVYQGQASGGPAYGLVANTSNTDVASIRISLVCPNGVGAVMKGLNGDCNNSGETFPGHSANWNGMFLNNSGSVQTITVNAQALNSSGAVIDTAQTQVSVGPQTISQTVPQSVTITYPQKGYSLSNGGKYAIANIQWTSTGDISSIGISLSDSTGKLLKYVATGIPNTGSYIWQNDASLPTGYYMLNVYANAKGGAGTSVGPIYVQNDYAATSVVQPAINSNYPTSSALSATCNGSPSPLGTTPSATWTAVVTGGASPYTYAWSIYGDATGYPGGSTQSSLVTVNYTAGGTKQAVARITDTNGSSVNATCSTSINTQPLIWYIGPNLGSAQTSVTLKGSNLSGASSIEFYNSSEQFVGSLAPSSVSSTVVTFTISAAFASQVSPGAYQVSVVTNNCPGGCNSNKMPFTFTAPSTAPIPAASPLSYACTGMVLNSTDISWSVQASGGTAPYTYAWSAYNDVASYIGGSTVSSAFSAKYSSSGTKQAIARITDANGSTVNATCSVTLTAVATAPAPTPAPASPSSTLLISLRSIHLGDLVTLLSNTTSPTASLRSAAIDMSTDNASWQSGAPCGYWNSPNGTDSAHAITCNFTPTAAGTYYFRTRGTDSVGASSFSYQTLTVLP